MFGESGLLENEPTVPAEQAHTTRFILIDCEPIHCIAGSGLCVPPRSTLDGLTACATPVKTVVWCACAAAQLTLEILRE